MELSVPMMAASYLFLQIGALFWATPAWRKLGRFPLWAFGVATIVLLVGNAMGAPLAPILMLVSLPLMTFYLLVLWVAYLALRPRRTASATA
ncbi:MAG: hypothetical protein QNJ13_04380 [Paracoccaceae bacterium]|nr:hypothetical protein [Paracoccaceae bacterium]